MKHFAFVFFILVSAFQAHAWKLEPHASYSFANTYTVKASESVDYDMKGAIVGLNFLFNFDDLVFEEDGGAIWGLGIDYASMKGEISDSSLAAGVFGSENKFQQITPYFIVGYNFTDFRIRLYLTPFALLKETSGLNDGDEKYGLGGKIEAGYMIYSSLHFQLGYALNTYDRGKNKSTGQSGSLSNKVQWSYAYAGFSFPFTLSNLFESSDTGYRSRRIRY